MGLNPSGLNAHYQPTALAEVFRALREAVEADRDDPPARKKGSGGRLFE